jgi:hypothetical protein
MVARRLIPALFVLLLATAAWALPGRVQSGAAGTPQANALRCDIEVEDFGASVRLQGVVISGAAVQGGYDMLVNGPGPDGARAEIRQHGEFATAAHRPARLGVVELRKDSGGYNAVLILVWNGAEYRCGKRIGEAWS